MDMSLRRAFIHNFLGNSPDWYKLTILGFLIANPLILMAAGPVVAGRAAAGANCGLPATDTPCLDSPARYNRQVRQCAR